MPKGAYLIAWEQEPSNHIAFRSYANFRSWSTGAQSNMDNASLYWGVGGNIGDREALSYSGSGR